jgi:alkanesulfonate monooxygenase SsuD/methylene tetrahydromethanopterin reductase-like flavin-dependent oxidoreductase (luciferase family)
MSGGRFILGIGAGWNKEEYLQYGYKFPSNRARIRQMEEATQIIKLLWKQDDVTFRGKYCQVENAYCNPKPDPVPPILIGGGGEKYLLKAVAKYADWWNGWCYNVETWSHKLNILANHCDNIGRDFNEILKSIAWVVALAESDEEAKKLVESSPFPSRWIIHGSPESITSQVGDLIDAGAEYFQLAFSHFPNVEGTKMFSEEVIPNL